MRAPALMLATALLLGAVSQATAAITVDGNLDPAYGLAKSFVAYDPAAPESNFGSPDRTTDAQGYSIYEVAAANDVYLFLQASGPGSPVANFANLYFDLDPQNNNGSDLGFEVNPTHVDAFIPGVNGSVVLSNVQVAASNNGTGLEIGIPNSDLDSPIAGLSYYNGHTFPSDGDAVTLRLSQSFGYSVAGGPTYGPDRLGTVALGGSVSAAPEPSVWALMMLGIGGIGLAFRQAKRNHGFHFKGGFAA